MPAVSAGVLLHRFTPLGLEVLLVHPGGPFWRHRDLGAWTIPKGLVGSGESLLAAALREFQEETGCAAKGAVVPLGEVRQAGGKTVHAWAVEGDFNPERLRSNTLEMEWPRGSGRQQSFPDVDQAAWFTLADARARILASQVPFLDRLRAHGRAHLDRATLEFAGPIPAPVSTGVVMTLQDQFGPIDIYLFDQLLRGRVQPHMRVLDAGCGGGRNLVYLMRQGFDLCATDGDPAAVARVREMAATLAPRLEPLRFRVEPVETCSFANERFDLVISSAVLHFARDRQHFEAMVAEMWRVLAPAGLLFARLASSIGIEGRVRPLGGGRFRLPDGSERYLVTEQDLLAVTRGLGGTLLDPLKTTIVHDQRAMTTWVVGKPSRPAAD